MHLTTEKPIPIDSRSYISRCALVAAAKPDLTIDIVDIVNNVDVIVTLLIVATAVLKNLFYSLKQARRSKKNRLA
ncbi:hypothetical protein [Burkholderia diffusa]|uniref:hypothetical protein n=1 Tax=Burkholderia diffusa TaxID=488732 RepID=UPI002ABE9F35|nr:hypothetical protein [Burkholderia diffusa]